MKIEGVSPNGCYLTATRIPPGRFIWVIGLSVDWSHLAEFWTNLRVLVGRWAGPGVCISRVVGIPWRVYFWFPFLGAQKSNFEGSGCPLGSNSERSGRPWGSILSSLGRPGRPCVTREPPRSPRRNFPIFFPICSLPFWSHFGFIF